MGQVAQRPSPELATEIDTWARQLYSPDPAIRSSAAVSLLGLGHPTAVEPLLNVLKGSRAIPELAPGNGMAPQRDILVSVIKAFGFKGDERAVLPLIDLLQDADPEVRQNTSKTLGKFSSPRAVEEMSIRLLDQKYPLGTRVLLAQSLGQTRQRYAVEPLLSALQSEEKDLQEAASEALSQVSKQSFGRDVPKWQEWWKINKAKTDEQWLEYIVVKLQEANEQLQEQNEALKKELAEKTVSLLGEAAGRKDTKPLLEAMRSAYPAVRVFATRRLSELKDPSIVPTFIVALKDKEKEVRGAAVQALGETPDERAVNPLINALWDEEASVREKAARALAHYKGKTVVGALIVALKSDETLLVGAAVEALGQSGDVEAVGPLIELLGSKDPKVREAAAASLGKLKDPRATKPLISALRDNEERVMWYAADSLGSIKDVEGVEPLIELLSTESARVRESAVVALGQIGNERAIEPLIKVMQDPDKRVAEQAADALVSIQTQSFEAMDLMANTLYTSKDYKRASKVLEKQIAQFSSQDLYKEKVIERKLLLARAYHHEKEWQKAVALYDVLSEQKPRDLEIKQGLTRCLMEVKQYDRLLDLYARWLKELPDSAQEWWKGRMEVMTTLYEQGNYAKVESLVDSFQLENPDLGGPLFRHRFLELAEKSNSRAHVNKGKAGTSVVP